MSNIAVSDNILDLIPKFPNCITSLAITFLYNDTINKISITTIRNYLEQLWNEGKISMLSSNGHSLYYFKPKMDTTKLHIELTVKSKIVRNE